MKITFTDTKSFDNFVSNIREDFRKPFDLFGQKVMIHTCSTTQNYSGGCVELDIVQVI